MNENFIREELIRIKYPVINYLLVLILFLFVNVLLFLFSYSYSAYYNNYGIVSMINSEYYLKVKVMYNDIDYFYNNRSIIIDNVFYDFVSYDFDEMVYIDGDVNYKYLYLKIDNYNCDYENLIVNFRIFIGKYKIIYYVRGWLNDRN